MCKATCSQAKQPDHTAINYWILLHDITGIAPKSSPEPTYNFSISFQQTLVCNTYTDRPRCITMSNYKEMGWQLPSTTFYKQKQQNNKLQFQWHSPRRLCKSQKLSLGSLATFHGRRFESSGRHSGSEERRLWRPGRTLSESIFFNSWNQNPWRVDKCSSMFLEFLWNLLQNMADINKSKHICEGARWGHKRLQLKKEQHLISWLKSRYESSSLRFSPSFPSKKHT